ncbi:MAG: type IV secretory system conjugative DNA transfer family protein, partial [Lachnospiraceae bacterium]|nr:type IV secretory system conjugative DNA transfer family protein [Lachnospiraceae bacterium]
SIIITVHSKIGLYDTKELNTILSDDTTGITAIGHHKSALFVVVSDNDRSLDGIANLFFTQAINELCYVADKKCRDQCLPVPVRFIMDDFATNCVIEQMPRIISSIRSRNISVMLMLQSESQLMNCYREDGRTIIANCDTYLYLGGNDVDSARSVSARCDLPLKKVLNMPVGNMWIFRRGEDPVYAKIFDLNKHIGEWMKDERSDKGRREDGVML